MIELQGYYPEEELIALRQDNKISLYQFYYHHSPERRKELLDFSKEKSLDPTEEAAEAFELFLLQQENKDEV